MVVEQPESAGDPFEEVHRRDEQRRLLLFGSGAVVVVTLFAVLALGGLVAPLVAPPSAAVVPSGTPVPTASTRPSATARPLPAPTPVSTPSPAPDLPAAPESHPSGYVLAWGRIFVRDTGGASAPRAGDCLRPSGTWEWYGVPYVRASCAEGFLVRALAPFPDGEDAAPAFADLQYLAYATCFSLYSRGTEVSSSSTFDEASNLSHWDLVTDVGTWVVEPAPGRLVCMEYPGQP